MSALNDTKTGQKFSNEKSRYTLSVSDTNDHDIPDVDGDDTAGGAGYRTGSAAEVKAKIVNNQDQDLTARLEATDPSDKGTFNEANKLVENVTVSSGGGVEALYWSEANDGDYVELRVVVSFGTAPSGNSDTVVEYRKSHV